MLHAPCTKCIGNVTDYRTKIVDFQDHCEESVAPEH